MKTIRKPLASLLALAMLLLLLPAAAFADGAECVLVLPAELKRIEDLAFTYALIRSMGCASPTVRRTTVSAATATATAALR